MMEDEPSARHRRHPDLIAVEAVLIATIARVSQIDPASRALICRVMEDAAAAIELALAEAPASDRRRLREALATLERMRDIAFGVEGGGMPEGPYRRPDIAH
jgi:ABC-type transporter Mla MlaB component